MASTFWTKEEREELKVLLNAGNRDFGAIHVRKAIATVDALEKALRYSHRIDRECINEECGYCDLLAMLEGDKSQEK